MNNPQDFFPRFLHRFSIYGAFLLLIITAASTSFLCVATDDKFGNDPSSISFELPSRPGNTSISDDQNFCRSLYNEKHHINEKNWVTAIFFAIQTITTTGYGGFDPNNDVKIISCVFMLLGVITWGIFVDQLLIFVRNR